MVFGNGVKDIQAAAYNGARTVDRKLRSSFSQNLALKFKHFRKMLQPRAMENLWKKNVGHNFNRHSWPTLPEFKNALRHTAAPVSESFISKLFFIFIL